MIPILGETVWSIIHGPATTSHIFELSQFLRRPINVWAKDKLLLFGRCHHRHKPRLHLKYKSLTDKKCPACGLSTGKAVGHFTLLEGEEPRNPDARSHPQNCGFDVVSDQTGYPATALRQVTVQRMLAKLYESRLRGRDHHFQCSRCSLSGGEVWSDEDSEKLIKDSKERFRGHAHMHVYRESCDKICKCTEVAGLRTDEDGGLKFIDCMDKYLQINNDGKRKMKTLFECQTDLIECLTVVMNSDHAKAAKLCIEKNDKPSCKKYKFDEHRARFVTYVGGLKKKAYSFTWDGKRNRSTKFYFKFKHVQTILKSRYKSSGLQSSKGSRVLYLETMYPIYHKNLKTLEVPVRLRGIFRPAWREQKQTQRRPSDPTSLQLSMGSSDGKQQSCPPKRNQQFSQCQPEAGGKSTQIRSLNNYRRKQLRINNEQQNGTKDPLYKSEATQPKQLKIPWNKLFK